jgi:hypothetical protein
MPREGGSMEDLTGKQLGQYRIVAPLGEGGMAAVYKAYQPSMNRYVALKILPRQYAGDPEFVGRFEREVRVIASLEHPNILPVHDYGEADGYTYIVMRYVEGGTLADWLHGQPLPLPTICVVVSQIARALDYAHSRGVVHRDVKPSNVLIDDQGSCLLTDFGIAKMVEATGQLTRPGAFIGTPTYASPEQCLGHSLDWRSDIYSLGIMTYQMATGRPPFVAETPMAIVLKHINDPLPLPRSLNPALPEPVERVILKALAKAPEDRYQGAGEMAQALAAACAQEVASAEAGMRPATPPLPRPVPGRRMPAWRWVAGGLAFLIVFVVLAGLVGGSVALWKLFAPPGAARTPIATAAPGTPPSTAILPVTTATQGTPPVTGSPSASATQGATLLPVGSSDSSPHPIVAIGPGAEVHLVWADTGSGIWDIYYARSVDGGVTFSEPIQVNAEATGAARGHPTLAVGSDGSVHVAWEEMRDGDWDIYYARLEGGEAFSPPTPVSDDATGTDQARPTIAVERDGTVHLAWQDSRAGDWDITYARSTDGGDTFSANLRVNTETRGQQVDPAIGVDGPERVHVAWADDRSAAWAVYHTRSEGEGFLRGRVVGSGLMADLSNELPSLTVGPDDRVHIAWANAYVRDPDYGALLYLPVYAVSTDRGGTFSDPRQVGEGYRYVSTRPPETGLGAGDGAAHVVLTTYSPRDGSWVWYYRSDDGRNFSAGVGVEQVGGGDVLHYPVVAMDGAGRVHVAWAHQRGDEWDVYHARSGDGGVTFSDGVKVSGER